MIDIEAVENKRFLIITPQGPLQRADFETIAKEFDRAVASTGRLTGLMIRMESFPGWETLEAFSTHIKFVARHHRSIERIAVATDSSFLKHIPSLAGYFVHPKIRVFGLGEREKALLWLEMGG